MKSPQEILSIAIDRFRPTKVILMFSGGHDSLVNSHVCASILQAQKISFTVYHGDTTIGIPETQEYVISVCGLFGWPLAIRRPPKDGDRYDELVKKFGFPGPTKHAHQIMYRCLKERALNAFVTHECKSKPHARENALLCSGVRREESRIRMGYVNEATKDHSKVWVNPIFYWTDKQCEEYMAHHSLPRNPVKDKICISGECLCGAFAGREEFAELTACYPKVAARIEALHKIAIENGHPWPWSSGPNEWRKNYPLRQLDMFMCVGCEQKKLFVE